MALKQGHYRVINGKYVHEDQLLGAYLLLWLKGILCGALGLMVCYAFYVAICTL